MNAHCLDQSAAAYTSIVFLPICIAMHVCGQTNAHCLEVQLHTLLAQCSYTSTGYLKHKKLDLGYLNRFSDSYLIQLLMIKVGCTCVLMP